MKLVKIKHLLSAHIHWLTLLSLSAVAVNVIDMLITDNIESRVFSVQHFDIAPTVKSLVSSDRQFLQDFVDEPYKKLIENTNIRYRDNSSPLKALQSRGEVYSMVYNNFVNFPIPALQKSLTQSEELKSQMLSAGNKREFFFDYMKRVDDNGMIFNFFLDVEPTQVIDFYFFHEMMHIALHDDIELLVEQKKEELKKNNIAYSKSHMQSLEEALCDTMAIMLMTKKYGYSPQQTENFTNAVIGFRFKNKNIIDRLKEPVIHDTEYANYLLKEHIATKGTDFGTFSNMKNLALSFAADNTYYSITEDSAYLRGKVIEQAETDILNVSLRSSYIYKMK